jgi:hypothetical protein
MRRSACRRRRVGAKPRQRPLLFRTEHGNGTLSRLADRRSARHEHNQGASHDVHATDDRYRVELLPLERGIERLFAREACFLRLGISAIEGWCQAPKACREGRRVGR